MHNKSNSIQYPWTLHDYTCGFYAHFVHEGFIGDYFQCLGCYIVNHILHNVFPMFTGPYIFLICILLYTFEAPFLNLVQQLLSINHIHPIRTYSPSPPIIILPVSIPSVPRPQLSGFRSPISGSSRSPVPGLRFPFSVLHPFPYQTLKTVSTTHRMMNTTIMTTTVISIAFKAPANHHSGSPGSPSSLR